MSKRCCFRRYAAMIVLRSMFLGLTPQALCWRCSAAKGNAARKRGEYLLFRNRFVQVQDDAADNRPGRDLCGCDTVKLGCLL